MESGSFQDIAFKLSKVSCTMTFCFPGCLHTLLFKQIQIRNTIQFFSWPFQNQGGENLENQFKLPSFVKFHLLAGFWWLSAQLLTQSKFIGKSVCIDFGITLGLFQMHPTQTAAQVSPKFISRNFIFSLEREESG